MKKILLIAIIASAAFFYSEEKKASDHLHSGNSREPKRNEALVSDSVKGDFNGDQQVEYAWLEPVPCANGELKQYCSCAVRFSNENIKSIDLLVYCLRGNMRNEGDLNDDGADDISVVTYERTDWSFCSVFSFRKNKWTELVEEFAVWGGVDENDIQKDPTKKGFIIIRELTARDSICVETRSVKMN